MKKKNISKKALAIFLSFVMIIASLPFAIIGSAAGLYDPAPKFSPEAIEEGARAWLDEDGNVHVIYPAAKAEDTYKGEELSIAFYILELVDMGSKDLSHTKVVLDTIKVAGTSGIFPAADIGKIDLENKRYSVTVTAVDTENWFSQPIYTTVTEVPTFEYDAERYQVFTADTTAAREIMTYDSGSDDGAVTGGVLQYLGSTPQVGVEDETGKDTNALRFMMRSQPTSTQTFDTSYSRQTWDYVGADEVWFWMDLTDVELKGLSFRLRAQEKEIKGWGDGNTGNVETLGDRGGSIVYSTKGTTKAGYTGEEPYVWVQREDGGWKKVMLKADGTLDIGDFKGYIRVPIEFMCSETDAVITARNDAFNVQTNQQDNLLAFIDSSDPSDEQIATATAQSIANINGYFMIPSTVVDPAGTCVTDALLLQKRVYQVNNSYWYARKLLGFINSPTAAGDTLNLDFGLTPAVQLNIDKGDYTDTDAKRATVTKNSDGTVAIGNRENAYKAIEDIYNAGFSIEGCSSDSIDNSFYLDNVFFYRDDGEQWTDLSLSGYDANTGETMYNYYDQETIIATAIFDAVDKYISIPDWADYREVEYILDMIDGYKRAIEEANSKNTTSDTKISTDFLSFDKLAEKSAELGRDSWQNAVDAYTACVNAGTIVVNEVTGEIICRANASKDELVPLIVNQLEKLPKPENITSVSDALREAILELWKTYALLNLGQLEMLGEKEEKTILEYILLLKGLADIDKEDFIVGQSLADRPFILFSDFENYEIGTQSYKLEDAVNIYNKNDSDKYTDYRYTKNLVTYAPETFEDFAGKSKDTDNNVLSTLLGVAQPTKDGFDNSLKTKASWATITEEGFQGSKGATMYIDSQFYSSGEGVYNVLSTTYMGAEAANIDALRALGTGNSSVKLGNLAKSFSGVEVNPYLSLVFYVDFTQLTDFNMSATIQTYFNGSLNDFQIAMGTNATDQNFFILDPDSGEWVQANNATDAGRSFAYTSRAGADTNGDGVFDITLAGYKGYVRIPLYHFKPGNNGQKLDESAEALNNIYRISIGIAPGSAAAAVEMDGNNYTIDNIGFSYDPSAYSDGVASRKAAGITDPYFDEFFDAKSVTAANFEIMVDAIDPYEKSTLQTEVTNALAVYNSLSDYQKSLVQEEKDTLDLYLQYVAGTSTLPKPKQTPEQVKDFIDTIPDTLKNATIDDIPYPGFSSGAVDYGAMGITREQADEIISYYQESYTRFSKTQKATITNSAQFINAYNMCMRMTQTLEDIKDDAIGNKDKNIRGFLSTLTELYTVKYDYDNDGVLENKDDSIANSDEYKIGNFVSIAERNDVQTYKETNYDPLQYYSKRLIDDGSISPQLKNTSRGFTYFLNNTRTFTVDGETIEGGIITFQKKMQNIYEMANGHITNQTLFTPEELQSVRDVINEYNAFLPAYYNVEELYELEQAISRLFPNYQTVMGEQTLMLSAENLSESTTYTIEYSEYLDVTDPYTDTFYVKVVSQNGGMTNDYGDNVNYNVTLQSNENLPYTVGASDLAGLPEDNWIAKYPVTNNSSTPSGTQEKFTLTAGVSAAQTGLRGMVTDVLTIQLCHPDGTVLEEQIVQVFYSMGDAYTVTIPADFPVDWDDSEKQDVSYSVITEMNATSSIKVKVSSDGTGKMASVIDPSLTLDYVTEGFDTEMEFSGMVKDGKPTTIPYVTVSGWDDVPVGEYRTTLTYTVVYEADDGTT